MAGMVKCATSRFSLGTVVCALVWLAVPAAAQASITIDDPVVREADGPTTMTFVVTRRTGLLSGGATIVFQTVDGTARAPGDYESQAFLLSFSPMLFGGVEKQAITIAIAGDTVYEPTESFTVKLSGPELVKSLGVGTILDDDELYPPPAGRSSSLTGVHEQLLARTSDGSLPDAPATQTVISQDARKARYAAYTSAAANITPGTDGHSNVFVVKRGGVIGKNGSPWQYGSTLLASAGVGGQPANGRSFGPALDGWSKGDTAHGPTCLAFVSEASNLVAGDANGVADAFVRKLRGGSLTRIGAPAAVSEVAVAGDCRTIAVVAGGTLYVKRRGHKKLRKIAAGAGSPSLSFNGAQISYSAGPRIIVRRIGGGAKKIAIGTNPTQDAGRPTGKVRYVAYERGGSSYIAKVSGRERHISVGTLPSMTAGGTQVMFAAGPYVYTYAQSNKFGLKKPPAVCPLGNGYVNTMQTSARGNYTVFSCTGGTAYLAYVGPK
jgi:Calx-beta domain